MIRFLVTFPKASFLETAQPATVGRHENARAVAFLWTPPAWRRRIDQRRSLAVIYVTDEEHRWKIHYCLINIFSKLPCLGKYTTYLPSSPSQKQESPYSCLSTAPCCTPPRSRSFVNPPPPRTRQPYRPGLHHRLPSPAREPPVTSPLPFAHCPLHASKVLRHLHHVLSKLSVPVPTHTLLQLHSSHADLGAPQTDQAPPRLRLFASPASHP